MNFQTVFKRYEIKYIITQEQKNDLLKLIKQHMLPDRYGKTTIRNIYYDTNSYQLIRTSIDKPIYKEKIRVRSYNQATPESTVFVELKKKYQDVVYKRRIAVSELEAKQWLCFGVKPDIKSQIANEIEYFRSYYGTLHPVVFLSYEREAFYSSQDNDLRLTLDENILARTDKLSLCCDVGGAAIIDKDCVLLEIKTAGGFPLWLTAFLTKNKLFKCSFSKYGTVYTNSIFQKKGAICYAN